MAASTSEARDALCPTSGKENLQRITRLLIAGGTCLLREIFDSIHPPEKLHVVLNASGRKTLLKSKKANLTKPQTEILYPALGVSVNSNDFDISLLFKLLTLICNLKPPADGWHKLPKDGDHNLESDLARVKFYRNTVHAHSKGSMEITDEEFEFLWVKISEALLRISDASGKKQEWSDAIEKLLKCPLTLEDEGLEKHLDAWDNDEELKTDPKDLADKMEQVKTKLENVQRTGEITSQDLKRIDRKVDELGSSMIEIRIEVLAAVRILLKDVYAAEPQVFNENLEKLCRDLKDELNLKVHGSKMGSLLITVECGSLEILEGLWESYCRGNLNEKAQKYLVTPEILNALGLDEVKLKTIILEEDYKACQRFLMQKEGKTETADVPVSVSERDENGLKPNTPRHEEEEKTGKRKASLAFQDSVDKEGKKRRKETKITAKRKLAPVPPIQPAAKGDSNMASASSTNNGNNSFQGAEIESSSSSGMPLKRKSSSNSEETNDGGEKRKRSLPSQSANRDGDFTADIVFALDCSSIVSQKHFDKQLQLVESLAGELNVVPGKSRAALVTYGTSAQTKIGFDANNKTLFSVCGIKMDRTDASGNGRIDLALQEAVENFCFLERESSTSNVTGGSESLRLVFLITAGPETHDTDEEEAHLAAYERLVTMDVQVMIAAVGSQIDLKKLGLMVKRPQRLFPLWSFDAMEANTAQKIGSVIRETLDIVCHAKNEAIIGIRGQDRVWTEREVSKIIGRLLIVMEGGWYLLYQQNNTKSRRQKRRMKKVEKLIKESIENVHSKLISESCITLSVAVFGLQGVGKSYMLNFLLNYELREDLKMVDGPLPSAPGGSQTPIPVRLKYGNEVQVSLQKTKEDLKPDVWYHSQEWDFKTLLAVKDTLKRKFQDKEALIGADYLVFQGPFPIFENLKTRKCSSAGHLEFEVNVEFEDLPGLGDDVGDDAIDFRLSRADVILFFAGGHSERPVTSEDLSAVFRRHDEFEFVSRPKLVLVVNPRKETNKEQFGPLREQHKLKLEKAWLKLLTIEDDNVTQRYQDVRKKLPQLGGEDLLKKLKAESEAILFHPENPDFLDDLNRIIENHVYNVKLKEKFHPFFKDVHWATKQLKSQLAKYSATARKEGKVKEDAQVEVSYPNLEVYSDPSEEEIVMESFVNKLLARHEGIDLMDVYHEFLKSDETLCFLTKRLEESLKIFSGNLIRSVENAYSSASQDMPEGPIGLAELFCKTQISQFCTNDARKYMYEVFAKGKDRVPFTKFKKRWSKSVEQDKVDCCFEFLSVVLDKVLQLFQKRSLGRGKGNKYTPFHLKEDLQRKVVDVYAAIRCLQGNPSRLSHLKILAQNLNAVIQACTSTIREINPHPSFENVQLDHTSLPNEIRETSQGSSEKQGEESNQCKNIIEEITKLLQKPVNKQGNPVRRLQQLLKLKVGSLSLRESEVDERRWALALVNVLSDKDHFGIGLDPSLFLSEKSRLLEQAKKRLFGHQKSLVVCDIVDDQSVPNKEIHLKRSKEQGKYSLQATMNAAMRRDIEAILSEFDDPTRKLAPIFIPTIRPGPDPDITGNYFLQENPWTENANKRMQVECESENVMGETENVDERKGHQSTAPDQEMRESTSLKFNIFLVVEKRHLETLKCTIKGQDVPEDRNLNYVVLPQAGRGIGVTRSIIKSLAEGLNFPLYWTVDDDIEQMYQFNENDRRWHKCTFGRGLLLCQRVFQVCLERTVRHLSKDERDDLHDDILDDWPKWAKSTKRAARSLLLNDNSFAEVKTNVGRLHCPFTIDNISADCGEDATRIAEMETLQQHFVNTCKNRLFDDNVNRIAGVALAHQCTRKYDYMAKYPSAHYMRSDQRYQVVLNNTCALREMNFVTDETIFHDEENQVDDKDKRNTPYWGIRGSDKSFCQALRVRGVIGYQVICITHSHRKLTNVFNRVGPSYIRSPVSLPV